MNDDIFIIADESTLPKNHLLVSMSCRSEGTGLVALLDAEIKDSLYSRCPDILAECK